MDAKFFLTLLIVSSLIENVAGYCGVHQKLDIVILYDESSSVGLSYFNDEIAFIGMLADALYIHANHTNIAGIGADHQAHYRWGLTDYFTSFDITANLYNITMAYGLSDLTPAIDMAWNNILSKNLRPGSTPWLFIITDTASMSSTTSLDAVKAAGIKVGFLTTLSASHYTSYASDSRYIVAGMSWSTITTYVSLVVTTLFCPAYCETFFFYYELPSSMNVSADTNSDVGYYLSGTDKAYFIHCCGSLSSMEYKATTSGTIMLQIWRTDTLAYQTTISISEGAQTYMFSPKVAILANDAIGWYSPGVNPIGKRTNCTGDLCPKDTRQADKMGTLATGAYFAWYTASYLPDTAFAIKFNVVNTTEPTFTQSSPVYISENTVVGTSVAVVSLTHDEGGDLVVSPPSSPYFDYNSTSGLISVISPLPVTNTETPYFLAMVVYDSCFNTASIVVNITTFPEPSTFQNLPAEVELGDDVTEETLLIVINVTDPNSDSFSCVQTSVLPNTTYFRLHDYMNGTAAIYLNANSSLDHKTNPEYQIIVRCTGSLPVESILTIKILDKSTSNTVSESNEWIKLYLAPPIAGLCFLLTVTVIILLKMKYKRGNGNTVTPVTHSKG
uniref:Uncharacterized protein LOC111103132 n=1 Tax=Crassostrea virginica TaxID=6565 RepID=A0A8B8AL57_CRAVI|nr:uncharacterized protein LOC111103132 [Crassostrea virginica]